MSRITLRPSCSSLCSFAWLMTTKAMHIQANPKGLAANATKVLPARADALFQVQGPVAASAAMAPLHRSNTDGPPRRAALPTKASLKSKGSILSHVTSGTWEEDADIEDPHQAEEKKKTQGVHFLAKIPPQ